MAISKSTKSIKKPSEVSIVKNIKKNFTNVLKPTNSELVDKKDPKAKVVEKKINDKLASLQNKKPASNAVKGKAKAKPAVSKKAPVVAKAKPAAKKAKVSKAKKK
ncbi:MAG: hypothetical protein LBB39_03790 [Mycoplasmataceae bacterium]|nr:hypothetical protein [Mycoplasmataceae bacterium]